MKVADGDAYKCSDPGLDCLPVCPVFDPDSMALQLQDEGAGYNRMHSNRLEQGHSSEKKTVESCNHLKKCSSSKSVVIRFYYTLNSVFSRL